MDFTKLAAEANSLYMYAEEELSKTASPQSNISPYNNYDEYTTAMKKKKSGLSWSKEDFDAIKATGKPLMTGFRSAAERTAANVASRDNG